jgi:hypothetical protein
MNTKNEEATETAICTGRSLRSRTVSASARPMAGSSSNAKESSRSQAMAEARGVEIREVSIRLHRTHQEKMHRKTLVANGVPMKPLFPTASAPDG